MFMWINFLLKKKSSNISEGLLGDLGSYLDSLLVAIKPFQIHLNFF